MLSPIKWTNSNIPFVLNFRDDENYSVKTYPPIYNFHTGKFNEQLNDVNLKLVQFSDTNPTFNFSPSNIIELKDAVFLKNFLAVSINNSYKVKGMEVGWNQHLYNFMEEFLFNNR